MVTHRGHLRVVGVEAKRPPDVAVTVTAAVEPSPRGLAALARLLAIGSEVDAAARRERGSGS